VASPTPSGWPLDLFLLLAVHPDEGRFRKSPRWDAFVMLLRYGGSQQHEAHEYKSCLHDARCYHGFNSR
jgi:hypothetical protein